MSPGRLQFRPTLVELLGIGVLEQDDDGLGGNGHFRLNRPQGDPCAAIFRLEGLGIGVELHPAHRQERHRGTEGEEKGNHDEKAAR
ncbi:MAG: hypothetical protein WDN28_06955 [Chthoniobacter sp.]